MVFNLIIQDIDNPIIFNVPEHRYFGDTKFHKGQRVYIVAYNKGDSELGRGEDNDYILSDVVDDDAVLNNDTLCSIHQIIPHGFYSFHKSQGLSYDKVALCIDDIWENTMIYTAITRARNDIKIFSFDLDNRDNILRFLIERWIKFNDFADRFISKVSLNKNKEIVQSRYVI
jgi:hypothetical protein